MRGDPGAPQRRYLRMASRRVRLGMGGVAAVLALGACGGNRYEYVANDQERTYLRVPSAWETFSLTASDDEGRVESLPSGVKRVWHVGFDSSDDPNTAHIDELAPAELVGDMSTYSLSRGRIEQMSLSQVRTLAFFGIDPVLEDPGAPPKWEVVSFDPITGPDGSQGSRVVMNVPLSDGQTWVTVDGSTLFDPVSGRMHILLLRCEASCYERSRATADEVATSWKVTP